MIDAADGAAPVLPQRAGLLQDGRYRAGQVEGIGGRTRLVEHHLQLGARSRELEHGLHEVTAVFAVEPGRAQDDVVAAGAHDGLFALQLGLSVDARRGALLVLAAGHVVGLATKNVIGADVQQKSPETPHGFGQNAWRLGVEQAAKCLVGFRFIHVGVSGTIHDEIDISCIYEPVHGIAVGDVKQGGFQPLGFHHIGKDKVMGRLGADVSHLAP